jgi:cell division protein FtsW (lipid II flippase)
MAVLDLRERRDARARRAEALLLGLAGLFTLLGFATLSLVRFGGLRPGALLPGAVWLLLMTAAHLALNRAIPRRDPLLLPVVALLTGWGLLIVDRLEPALTWSHVGRLALGVAALGALSLFTRSAPGSTHAGLRWLKRYRYTWLLLALALLAATFVLGVNPLGRGLRLWLNAGGLYLQPSELLKIPLLVYLASYLSEHRTRLARVPRRPLLDREQLAYLIPLLITWALSLVLLVLQRDLGTATLFLLVFVAMLYMATEDARYLAGGALLVALSGLAGYFLYDIVAQRFDIWWNPWPDASGRAFQIVQSLYAVAAGGLIGQGIGQGAPGYVPAAHTDFPFAAIAEEFGLFGALGVLLCYALLVARAARAAELAGDGFQSLLAAGIGLLLGLQSAIILGGNLKLVPLTGVTLPFVSYGGSSLLASFILLALLLRVSQEAETA